MLDECPLTLICPAKRSFLGECVPYLLVMIQHPDLSQDDKFLYLWLVIRCSRQSNHTCAITYAELSRLLDKAPKKIHMSLLRLKVIGFLNGDIPIWYGDLTPEMMTKERKLEPVLISEKDFQYQQMIKKQYENNTFIWRRYDNMN